MKQDIIKACESLKEALLAEYEVSQQELECKSKKNKTHNDTLIARDALRDLSFN
jgi:CRISPR/Cas system-associated endonuclease Cas3-HD